jgi:DNA-directed RNA polymerase specialized sigma subunit
MPKWVASIQAAMELETKRAEDPRALWDEYRRSGDRGLRDRLIMTYAPLVKYIATRRCASYRRTATSTTSSHAASRRS